jgi:hypothetical protein
MYLPRGWGRARLQLRVAYLPLDTHAWHAACIVLIVSHKLGAVAGVSSFVKHICMQILPILGVQMGACIDSLAWEKDRQVDILFSCI